MVPDKGGAPTSYTILVVDDQETNRLLLSRPLELAGYHVLRAADGAQALTQLAAQSVDVVLLDVVMKGMNGYEVCRHIKSDPRTMFVPVIMVTILNNRDDRVRAIEAGADEFLSKPVYHEELLARVRSLIRWNDARRELEQAREERIRDVFKRYMCPKVVDDILASPTSKLRGLLEQTQRREAVVLFTDLRGFTAMSEHVSADEVVRLLNVYIGEMTRVAHAYEGTMFNMAGDSLLVAFGVPFAQAGPADRAFDAAIDMQRSFRSLSDRLRHSHGVGLGLGIGINAGEVVFGNVGAEQFMNYTVIGDTVNVAARLQGIAQAGEVVISESAVAELSGARADACHELAAPVNLKGRSEPLRVYRCRAA